MIPDKQIEFADSEREGRGEVRPCLDGADELLVLTIPGCHAPRALQIVSEIATCRFRNASALVSYAGLNSSVSQSGSSTAAAAP